MAVNCRRATLEDIPRLRELEQALVVFERDIEPTLKEGPLEYYDIPALIADTQNAVVLVLESDGEIMACGLAQIRENNPSHRNAQYGYVGLMYVSPEHRGQGLGRRIIQELEQWCVEKGLKEMQLDVYASNSSAIGAYAKAGFSPYISRMRKDLSSTSS